MPTLDEITKEKQRVSEALSRVDAQRERLIGQLGELEATERVLARYSKGTQTTWTASTRATRADAPVRGRGRRRTTTAGPAAGERTSPSLGDQIHTMEGMFADPIYGGNQDFAGWRLIGFPGAQPLFTPEDLESPQAFTHEPTVGLQGRA